MSFEECRPLKDRVALVTGGSRGIGAGINRKLAAWGCTLAVNYVDRAGPARRLAAELEEQGTKVSLHQADLGETAAVEEAPGGGRVRPRRPEHPRPERRGHEVHRPGGRDARAVAVRPGHQRPRHLAAGQARDPPDAGPPRRPLHHDHQLHDPADRAARRPLRRRQGRPGEPHELSLVRVGAVRHRRQLRTPRPGADRRVQRTARLRGRCAARDGRHPLAGRADDHTGEQRRRGRHALSRRGELDRRPDDHRGRRLPPVGQPRPRRDPRAQTRQEQPGPVSS